jgi:DNA-binding XRE family transcriptional regulator
LPYADHVAAARLVELREDAGLSQEALAHAIKRYAQEQDWYKLHGAVDAFTIRSIERDGHCPSERVRLVIALYFGAQPRSIWQPQNRRAVEARRRAAA